MIQKFSANISKSSLFKNSDFLLVAISGGVDSVVLADLLYKLKYQWAAAHCHFSLRGAESEEDEYFVHRMAERYKVPCFSVQFDTEAYARQKKISIQMAARSLRYKWFQELMAAYGFDYLLTAHHLDDAIETVLLNQLRGTGIRGVTGIPEKKDKVVRPLLSFSKAEILQYAQENNLSYREDSSNTNDTYQRNFIRRHIVPQLQRLQPALHSIFFNNILHFREAVQFLEYTVYQHLQTLIKYEKNYIRLSIAELQKLPYLHFVIQFFLSDKGFREEAINDMVQHIQHRRPGGKCFYSDTHIVLLDRIDMLVYEKSTNVAKHQRYIAFCIEELNMYSEKFHFEVIPYSSSLLWNVPDTAYVNADKLSFPLILRHRQNGDVFQLLGTPYQKKLSDILIDKKVPLIQKEELVLLCNSNGDIVWISELNLINERYKIDGQPHHVLKICTR